METEVLQMTRLWSEDLERLTTRPLCLLEPKKGYNTKTRQYRNFGMAKPEGYRKALRLMKTAEKFRIPIISFIDTPGAYPGLGAEEQGQGQAIANNIFQMLSIKTPIIVTIIGEGASGGALGIGVEILFICWKIPGTQLFLPNLALRYYGGVGNTKKQPQKL